MAVAANSWTTNYLQGNFQVLDRDVLITGWAYSNRASTQVGLMIISAEAEGVSTHQRRLVTDGGAGQGYYSVADTANTSMLTGVAYPFSTWYHLSGYDKTQDVRNVYQDAVKASAAGVNRNPNAATITRIGSHVIGTLGGSDWKYAEISAWDISAFTDNEVDTLVSRLYTLINGAIPNARVANEEAGQIWTNKLLHYWPLVDNTDLNDVIGTKHFSMTGTVTTFTHPDVQPYSPPVSLYPATEALYLNGVLLANKSNIKYVVTEGTTNLTGVVLGSGDTATTDALGFLQFPSPVEGTAENPVSANDPVILHLYWEEGNPAVDRSLIVKTTLVEDV